MKLTTLSKRLIALAMGAMLLGTTALTAFAADPEANISQKTIPVKATIDSYYLISTPANLDLNGNLNLTRDYNASVTSDGDNNSTFYGYTTVGVQGSVDTNKHVHVDLTCDDLVKNGETSSVAPVGMKNLGDTDGSKIAAIWATDITNSSQDTIRQTNAVAFGSTAWAPGSSTGITMDFASSSINTTADATQYAMLRTILPKDGTYEGNLVLDFSVVNN